MSIDVNGDNNRVAGRDYYELHLKPCPCCEVRVIEPHAHICNHCQRQRDEENAKGFLSLIALAVAAVFLWLLGLRHDMGLETAINDYPKVLLASGFVVGACCFVLWLIYSWWRSR